MISGFICFLVVTITAPDMFDKNYEKLNECVKLYIPEQKATDFNKQPALHLFEVKWW